MIFFLFVIGVVYLILRHYTKGNIFYQEMASEHRLQENGRSPVPLSPYTQTRYYRKNFSFILNFISVNYSYLTWEPDSQTWCYGHIGLASLQVDSG